MQIKRKKEGNCRNTTRMKLTSNQKYIANGSNNAILTFYGEKEHKERPTNKPSIGTTEPLPRVEGVLEGCERISVLSPASPGWSSFEHPGRVPPTTMRRKEKGQWPAKAQA